MADVTRQRREPVQARSRETVARILDAAADLINESGVDAASTRAIAERAGVAVPSLYRFFADRDEILDRLLERLLLDLDQQAEAAERTWQVDSIAEYVDREIDLHVAFYEAHPSLVRLWFGGRISPAVVAEVHERNRALARRARRVFTEAGLVAPGTDQVVFDVLVELGDRVLDLAFRGSSRADRELVDLGRIALTGYLEQFAPGSRGRA